MMFCCDYTVVPVQLHFADKHKLHNAVSSS